MASSDPVLHKSIGAGADPGL